MRLLNRLHYIRNKDKEFKKAIEGLLHTKQRDVFLDKSKYIAMSCTRRAGKSYTIAAWLIYGAITHYSDNLYLCQTIRDSVDIIKPAIEDLCRKLKIPFEYSIGKYRFSFENGSTIKISALSDRDAAAKFRGQEYYRIAIDECQSIKYAQAAIEEVLSPALVSKKHPVGAILISGTPSPIPYGFYYDVIHSKYAGYNIHNFSWRDNTYLGINGYQMYEEAKKILGENNPKFRREWNGEYVSDLGSFIFPFEEDHLISSAPNTSNIAVMAIDLGASLSNPTTSLSVVCTSLYDDQIYILESSKRAAQSPSSIFNWINETKSKYPYLQWNKIIMDQGGLGGAYILELERTYHITINSTKKTDKLAFIEFFRNELILNKIKIIKDMSKDLLEEWGKIRWAEKGYDEISEDHCSMSVVYGVRNLPNCRFDKVITPVQGTPEWYKYEQGRMREAALKKVRQLNMKPKLWR